MSAKIMFAVRSDVGNVRSNNEDNLFCNGRIMTASERERPFFFEGVAEAPAIFAVCDGMGGEDCGEVASLTAVEELVKYSRKIHCLLFTIARFVRYIRKITKRTTLVSLN